MRLRPWPSRRMARCWRQDHINSTPSNISWKKFGLSWWNRRIRGVCIFNCHAGPSRLERTNRTATVSKPAISMVACSGSTPILDYCHNSGSSTLINNWCLDARFPSLSLICRRAKGSLREKDVATVLQSPERPGQGVPW